MPLMALVDYRGFRLIAISLLPIDEKTIIYGSSDGGKTIHNDDEQVEQMMKRAAEILNLKPHECGIKSDSRKTLCSAADIEGHKGKDGRYYLIDFSRTFPCVKPDRSVAGSNITNLFRPEFVRSFSKQLCPDSYSRFTDTSYNQEIDEATEYLRNVCIPLFACSVVQNGGIGIHRLTAAIHSKGINVNLLGLLFSEFHHPRSELMKNELGNPENDKSSEVERRIKKTMASIFVEIIGTIFLLILSIGVVCCF